jgi:hypothetical protein
LDASGSTDAEGPIASYQWDFGDSHSGDNTATTQTPRVKHTYDFSGQYVITLRVFDGDGLAAETQRMIQVVAGQPPAPVSEAALRSAGGGATVTMLMQPTAMMDDGFATMAGDSLLRTGALVRGRLNLGRRLAAPLDRTLRPRWVAGFMIKQNGHASSTRFAVEGQMLLDFGRGERLCVSARLSRVAGTRFSGRLAVIGGSGRAARVGGGGTLATRLDQRGMLAVNSRLRLAPRRRARPLPPECRTLARASRRGG